MKEEIEKKYHVKVHAAQLDLTDPKQCDEFYEKLPAEWKDVDILVNNAGLAASPAVAYETDWEKMNTVIDTNIKGVVKMLNMFVPAMIKKDAGHIINVGSIAGKEAYAKGSIYCGTKHMVEAITNSLRIELVATPIRVTLISPGMVETEFSVVRFGDKEKADAFYKGVTPLNGDDIADTIVYAASRPPHVQVVDVVTFATNQATVTNIHRNNPEFRPF